MSGRKTHLKSKEKKEAIIKNTKMSFENYCRIQFRYRLIQDVFGVAKGLI